LGKQGREAAVSCRREHAGLLWLSASWALLRLTGRNPEENPLYGIVAAVGDISRTTTRA